MRYFFLKFIFFVYLLLNTAIAEEIRIINLHSDSKNNEKATEDNLQITETNEELFIQDETNETETNDLEEQILENFPDEELNENQNENIESEESIVTISEFWQGSNKDDLEFLFNNIEKNNSKILTNLLVQNLIQFINTPKIYSQEEFDKIRVQTLIKLGHKKQAVIFLNSINTYDSNKQFYDMIKLNYHFSINDLTEACSFKEVFNEKIKDNNNLVLKINIFCSFLENKIEEADFLNALLIDIDEDEYFQKIYYNLRNQVNESVEFDSKSFSNDALALYSAMLRIGNFPLNEKLLEYDPINLSLPIILSPASDISLRLRSAHTAYFLDLFNSESLSALYQSVDFNIKQLNNSSDSIKKFKNNPEMGMALLYQKSNIQLLPITRLESLKEFWNYAKVQNFEILSYDVSRNLIDSIQPSVELSDFALLISRAHISNKNFEKAKNWISFSEKYFLDDSTPEYKELQNIKLLYDLKTSQDMDTFINTLFDNNFFQGQDNNLTNNEILLTIISILMDEDDDRLFLKQHKKLIDDRMMPSSYIIEKIIASSNNNNIGELILTTNVSLNGKKWSEIHPIHLKILFESIKKSELEYIIQDLIIEILEESKII